MWTANIKYQGGSTIINGLTREPWIIANGALSIKFIERSIEKTVCFANGKWTTVEFYKGEE